MQIEDRVIDIMGTMVRKSIACYTEQTYVHLRSVEIGYDKKYNQNYLINIEAVEVYNNNRNENNFVITTIYTHEKDLGEFTTPLYEVNIPYKNAAPIDTFLYPACMTFSEAILFFKESLYGNQDSIHITKNFNYSYLKLYKPQDLQINPSNHLMYELKEEHSDYTQYFYIDIVTKEITGKTVDNATSKTEYDIKKVHLN